MTRFKKAWGETLKPFFLFRKSVLGTLYVCDKRKRYFYSLLFFFTLVGVTFGNSLHGDFILDDMTLIVRNQTIQSVSWENITRVFTRSFFDVSFEGGFRPFQNGHYYRPLVLLTFMSDFAIWHRIPFGYHATNIMVHYLTVCFIFFFMLKMSSRYTLAFPVATLFAVHPIHSRYVASISGRTDLLCFLFFMLTLVLYQWYLTEQERLRKNLASAGMLLSYAGALLSKEMAIMIPCVVVLYDMCFSFSDCGKEWQARFRRGRDRCGTYVVLLLMTVLYFIVRRQVLGAGLGEYLTTFFDESFCRRLLTVTVILFGYVKTLFFPVNIHYGWHYVELISECRSIEVIGALAFCFLFFVGIIVSWKRNRYVFFGLSWFAITYFPGSNIIPVWKVIAQYRLFTGEQFLHIPSMGFMCAVVSGILSGIQTCRYVRMQRYIKRIGLWACIGYVFLCVLYAAYYNIAWTNFFHYEMTLLEENPAHIDAYNDLGVAYLRAGENRKAIHLLELAMRIQEQRGSTVRQVANPYVNLIGIYFFNGLYGKATEVCDRLLRFFPDHYYGRYYLGKIAYIENRYHEAFFHTALSLAGNPTLPDTIALYETLLLEHSPRKDEIAILKERVRNESADFHALFTLASLFRMHRLYERAIEYNLQLLEHYPDCYVARSNLAFCYEKMFMKEKAREEQKRLCEGLE